MCLIFFAHRSHPRLRLILAANRDEFYRRPTTPAHRWDEPPGIIAGVDYGTRSSSVLLIDNHGAMLMRERTFLPDGSGWRDEEIRLVAPSPAALRRSNE